MNLAIPILPSTDLDRTTEFYAQLGFAVAGRYPAPDDYLIVRRDGIELHFWQAGDIVPDRSIAACYLRVHDVDALLNDWRQAGLPAQGIPRLSGVEDKPWGMREFHIVDHDGTLLRVGQMIRC